MKGHVASNRKQMSRDWDLNLYFPLSRMHICKFTNKELKFINFLEIQFYRD